MQKLKQFIGFLGNENTVKTAAEKNGFAVMVMLVLLAVVSIAMGVSGKLYYLSANDFVFASTGLMVLAFFVFFFRAARVPGGDVLLIAAAIVLVFLKIYLNYTGNWHPDIESVVFLKKIPVLYVLAKNFSSFTYVFDGIILFFIMAAFLYSKGQNREIPSGETPELYYLRGIFVCCIFLFFAALIYRTAWAAEDAYISFRTVDNFVKGYGLTWNVEERVQSFTNPLWVLFFSVFYFFTREAFFTSIVVTTFLTLSAVYLIFFKSRGSFVSAVIAVFILAASKPFMEYATGGLENAPGYLISVIFFLVYLRRENDGKKMLFLSFAAALGALNRLDLILIFIPALIHIFLTSPDKKRAILFAAAGFAPLAGWLVFSFFYYGYILPNTYYAKITTEISSVFYRDQGLFYLKDSLRRDIVTLPAIAAVFIACLARFDLRRFIVALSAVLYVLYTVKVGGCFMTGRFLSIPVLLAAIAAADFKARGNGRVKTALVIAFLFSAGAGSEWSHLINGANYAVLKKGEGHNTRFIGERGIADERAYYIKTNGLFNAGLRKEMPVHSWAGSGWTVGRGTRKYYEHQNIGMFGFFARQKIYVIDVLGLADPFLARMPVKTVRIGHFYRELPEGYLETVSTGENVIADPGLREYYEKIKFIARGPVFDPERLKTAINMNLGKYEYLKEDYVKNYRK
ncbi:MAG: hypothetical protein ACLFP1_09380 [Candidatus Goldiibacteriota bacterium]